MLTDGDAFWASRVGMALTSHVSKAAGLHTWIAKQNSARTESTFIPFGAINRHLRSKSVSAFSRRSL